MAQNRVNIDINVNSKQAQSDLKSFSGSFTEFQSKLGVAQIAVETFAGVFRQAFQLGKEGAQIAQTAASFDTLLDKVGAAPDLLRQLQDAAGGTIDDMTLMSSVATLVAGTQGDFATSLANTTPELLEIARAASALNPSLGDSAQLFNDIATGIKRGSPLILDNLGLTIKLGDANKKYADQLGKTVDELSETEKQQALLNATLDAGAVLIEQAGGSADSAVDSFARLETSMTNAGNAIKSKFAPFLAQAADAVFVLLEAGNMIEQAVADQAAALVDSADSWDEYRDGVTNAAIAAGFLSEAQADQLTSISQSSRDLKGLTTVLQNHGVEVELLSESEFDLAQKIAALGDSFKAATPYTDAQTAALERLKTASDETQEPIDELTGSMGVFNDKIAAGTNLTRRLMEQFQNAPDDSPLKQLVNDFGLALGQLASGAKSSLNNLQNLLAFMSSNPGILNQLGGGSGAAGQRRLIDQINGGDGFHSGGDFIVPPGFPNDSFPLRVESGERVIVQTPEQQRAGGLGGVTININGAGDPRSVAEAVSAELARMARLTRASGGRRIGA